MRIRPYMNHPRQRLYREFLAYVRRDRLDLLQVVGATALVAGTIMFLTRGFLGGLLIGLVLMLFALLIVWNFLINEDGLRYLHGAWAEDWTREELRSAVKAGNAWHAVDNVGLPAGDVDHVLIAPGGVIAVETKYLGNAGRLRYLDQLVADTSRAAVRVRGLLSTVKAPGYPVRPILVVWGPGSRALADTSSSGNVMIVKGKVLEEALLAYSKGPLAQDHAETLSKALLRYRMALPTRRH